MTGIRGHIGKVCGFIRSSFVGLLGVVAAVLFLLSFRTPDYGALMRSAVTSTQNRVHRLQRTMEVHIEKALQEPAGSCLDMDDLPEEMILYKYNQDTLYSWINRFPVVDDYSDSRPYSYRLNSLQEGASRIAPLSYLTDEWQYVNLGRDWFLVCKRHSSYGDTKIVAGIRLKMKPVPGMIFTTLSDNPDNVVYSLDGAPLFSISSDAIALSDRANIVLKWLSFLFTALMLIFYHKKTRTWRSFFMSAASLVILRLAALFLADSTDSPLGSDSIFSPVIYADNNLFSSFGDFLLNNLLLSIIVLLLFYIRKDIAEKSAAGGKRLLAASAAAVLTVTIGLYIFFALRSLILNSNIVLEPFRINELSFNTLLSYLSFAMLILALLFSIHFLTVLLPSHNDLFTFSWREMILTIALISVLFVIAEGKYGLKKEYDRNRVNTSRLAIERDMPIELYFRSIESQIAGDRFIAALAMVNGRELIRNRLLDSYFNRMVTDRYDISLTICGAKDYFETDSDGERVSCYEFFGNILDSQGQQIEGSDNFTFINNFDGKTSYIGAFPYYDADISEVVTLFITFDAKHKGNPFAGIGPGSAAGSSTNPPLSALYSYARYSDGHLSISSGDYNYSSEIPTSPEMGYTMVNKDGYIHFINKMSDNSLTVISRRHHPLFTYIVSFSYLFMFFAIFALLCTAHYRKGKLFELPKHSLKRKISLLIVGPMILALAGMAISIILINVTVQEQRDRKFMEDKLNSVQSALSEHCRYANRFSELCNSDFINSMEQISRISNVIINIYGIDGSLLCSTSNHPAGRRMHHKAFHEIVHQNSLRFICDERIDGVSYQSAFAPLFNATGEMAGIVNVPFHPVSNNVTTAISSMVATIINLSIVLLITAVLISVILSNSILNPIRELSRKMGVIVETSGKDRHISYIDSKDEIGVLVKSYNEMVDALDESSRKLAQTERETAWQEMARQIAHEIKNPLTPMRLSIQYLIRLKNQNADGWQEKVDAIGKSLLEQIDILAERASEFSSIAKSLGEPEVEVDIDELVSEQVTLFDTRDDISLVYDCRVDRPLVRVRRKQLARVFLNLITNSIQAIDNASVKEGKIRITVTETVSSDGRSGYRMDFEDNGPGVSDENLIHLFQPDFTTKSSGTGLGLSICKSIVESSSGTIGYAPSPNLGGACFTIFLPA